MIENKISILIVDDNPQNINVLVRYLEQHHYNIFIAYDGEDGFKKAVRIIPDIILLDIVVPNLDGFEACKRLKNEPHTKDIPVIFMTALSNTQDKLKAFKLGGVDYITKPIQHAEMLARINTHVSLRNAHKKLEAFNRFQEHLFSIISYDLKNSFSELLSTSDYIIQNETNLPTSDVVSNVKHIHRASKGAYQLLEELLELLSIKTNKMPFQPMTVQFSEIIDSSFTACHDLIQQKNIKISHSHDNQTAVFIDVTMAMTFMKYLIQWIINYMSEDEDLTIALIRSSNHVTCQITDSGPPLDTDSIEGLFYLNDNTPLIASSHQLDGGLRMFICKELIEKNNGIFTIERDINQKNRYIIQFPLSLPTHELTD